MTTEIKSTLTFQGIDLPVVRRGSGPQILMLHGGDGPVSHFPFVNRLAEEYEIIHPIHPGFDGTAIPEHFDNLQDLIFLYLDLIDHLDLSQATLMGFAMGGWAAAEMAVMNTRRFSRLLLVDSVGIKPGGPFDRDIADVFAISTAEQARLGWHDPSNAPDPVAMTDDELQILAANSVTPTRE